MTRILLATTVLAVLTCSSAEEPYFTFLNPGSEEPQGGIAEELFGKKAAIVATFRRRFLANLNWKDSGAVVASPGACPALDGFNLPGEYRYDWMRDGALSMLALQRLANSKVGTLGGDSEVTVDSARELLRLYARWVRDTQGVQGFQENGGAHAAAKWVIEERRPYTGGWCEPQSDGAPLRALTLMFFASRHGNVTEKEKLWDMIRFDLDWVASKGLDISTCDLWEETRDEDFFWNRIMSRKALTMGSQMATYMKDSARAKKYVDILAENFLHTAEGHIRTIPQGQYLSECPKDGGGAECQRYEKFIDGAVILSLIHGDWLDDSTVVQPDPMVPSLKSKVVADTVRIYNEAFAKHYHFVRDGQPLAGGRAGILYGRYVKDEYGGGNPWQLITAALATLMYQIAQTLNRGASLDAEELAAWRRALDASFGGKAADFVAAGDAVLHGLFSAVHGCVDVNVAESCAQDVDLSKWHLYEQIRGCDSQDGPRKCEQYNAKDLTWSYAEVLTALMERDVAIGGGTREPFLAFEPAVWPRPHREPAPPFPTVRKASESLVAQVAMVAGIILALAMGGVLGLVVLRRWQKGRSERELHDALLRITGGDTSPVGDNTSIELQKHHAATAAAMPL